MSEYKVVAFIARHHGLAALHPLLRNPRYRVVAIFTHAKVPGNNTLREDFPTLAALATFHQIPLHTVDSDVEWHRAETWLLQHPCDLLLSVSWRRFVPKEVLDHMRIGSVNLHRGKLPEYKGAHPVSRAVAQEEANLTVTAHLMTEKIDEGPILATASIARDGEEDAEKLKERLTPLFGPLAEEALHKLTEL